MNIEHLLNYLLADAFGRVAQNITILMEGKKLDDTKRKHMEGFCNILQGQTSTPEAPRSNVSNRLGAFGSEQSPNDMQEMLDALRGASIEDITNMDDEDGGLGGTDEPPEGLGGGTSAEPQGVATSDEEDGSTPGGRSEGDGEGEGSDDVDPKDK